MRPKDRYTYTDAGFNGFLSRSLKSNPAAASLRGGMSSGSGKPINLDLQQMMGALGNKLTIGRIVLDGQKGRVILNDDQNNEMLWIGDLVK